jgi:hypothetical protein
MSAKGAKKANQGMRFPLRVLRTTDFPESRVSSRALAPLSDPRLAALDPTYGIALV